MDTKLLPGRFFELGESDQFVFVVQMVATGVKSFQISKTSVEYIEDSPKI